MKARILFQSLSGLTLGLNGVYTGTSPADPRVSIPFRADTGFEHVSVPGVGVKKTVSIPFRADTGFELEHVDLREPGKLVFQSLSGLTLGLNLRVHSHPV